MKKFNLFSILDLQNKRLEQVHSLTNLLLHAGGLLDCKQNDLCGSVSLLSDAIEEIQSNHEKIAECVISLHLVNDCVQGKSCSGS